MDTFGKEYHSQMLAESVSQCSIKLKKMFNGEVIRYLKSRLKRLCYYK